MIWLYVFIGIVIINILLLIAIKKDGKFIQREIDEEKKHWDETQKNN